MFSGFDHVQLAMPIGQEAQAIAFYQGVLGMKLVPKPEPLAARGGCWFSGGAVELHVDDCFGNRIELVPARST